MSGKPIDRSERVRIVREMTRRGSTSRVIGKRLGIAESTVREYRRDPFRELARARQRRWGVTGVHMPAGGPPIRAVKGRTGKWHPHTGDSQLDAAIRGRQMRAVIGFYARRGGG